MSPAVNPVTDSLNVTVTGIGDVLVGFGAAELMATVGGVLSIVYTSPVAGALVISCEIPATDLVQMVNDHQAWAAELVATEELTIVGLDTGHWPMFSAPRELGELMVQALAPKPTDGP